MKNLSLRKSLTVLTLVCLVGNLSLLQCAAQSYETSLTSGTATENFDGLGINSLATLPDGWVFAQGVTLPVYSSPLSCQSPPFRFLTNSSYGAPFNCRDCTRAYDGGTSGGTGNTASPTGGGRINYSDLGASDRSVGFMSLNSTVTNSTTDYRSPTNYVMFGFVNNTGSNIVSLAVTNNIKLFRMNNPATYTPSTAFYYSYDGSNWTSLAAGKIASFNVASNYYFSAPVVSNVSFTISSLNISNGSPFYLAWQFLIANSSGSGSSGLALDDVGLKATFGVGATIGNSVWPVSSGNWNTAGNWLGSTLPISGNTLVFTGSGGNSTNNLAAVSTGTGTLGALVFSNSAGSYAVTGGAVSLAGGVTNNSTSAQTIGLPITLLADQSIVAASGNLILNGNLTNSSTTTTFGGNSNLTLNGAVVASGNLTMAGTGKLLLNGSNTYSGATILNSGTTQLGGSEKIPDASAVSVATGATFDLNNFSETIGNLAGAGSVTLSNATLTFSSGSGSFSGTISGNGGLTKIGSGTQTITATNNYHGTTLISGGTLAVGPTAVLGDGTINLNGGTYQTTGTRDLTNGILQNALVLSSNSIIQNSTSATAGTRNLPFAGSLSGTSGTLTLQNIATGNFTNVLHLRIHGVVTNFALPIVFDNSLAASAVNNTAQLGAYNTNGSLPQLYSGNISGPGRFFRSSLFPGLGGTAILTGSNTFTLGTTVNRGYLGLGSDSISSGGVVVSGPVGTGTLQIDDDTVAGQPGVGIFAYGGARTIENRILLNGVTNTVISGTNKLTLAGSFDVGGVPKILTLSNSALTVISGSFTNTANFTKAGPGQLVLTADNGQFWSGSFALTEGAVAANNVSGSATGTNTLTISGGTLMGTGLVANAIIATSGGSVTPGYNVGTLTLTSGLDLTGGGALVWTLGANSTNSPGVNYSQLALTGGELKLGGASVLTLAFTNSATAPAAANSFWQVVRKWRIATLVGGAISSGGAFTTISNGTNAAGTFATSTDGAGVLLTFTPSATNTNPPAIGRVSLSGSTLSFYLTNGSSGAAFQIVTSTNLTQAIGFWSVATNGNFSANGTTTNGLIINPAEPQRFYRVKLP